MIIHTSLRVGAEVVRHEHYRNIDMGQVIDLENTQLFVKKR